MHFSTAQLSVENMPLACLIFQCQDETATLKVPESIKNCKGAASVYDVQADELPLEDFLALTKPLAVLR